MEAKSELLLGLLVVFGIAVTAQDVASQTQRPSFCGTNDCPSYQLLKKYENFEHRHYEETRWVVTPLVQDVFGIEMMKSFRRLFKYITGMNSEGQTINMTVPVAIDVPLESSSVSSTMSFFVPHEVENPPTPTDPEIHLKKSPEFSAYVRQFGGYALGFMYEKHAKALAEDLKALGLQFDETYYVRAGYNDPFTLFNRHNEVWYIAK
ncbi:heme-binding protein 2-like [Hyla sarda]|uniref:heme-binding protein 2-like n=1 Tax=Hyla sarda TaxID=327740 RepID=UPI0024C43C2A|nr:heme-binding protein 2-like [Hyla sarda]